MVDIKEGVNTETINNEHHKEYSDEELKFLDFMAELLFEMILNECEKN